MNAFFNCVFLFDLKPLVEKVIVNLSLYSDAFKAFFRRFVSPLAKANVHLYKVSQ
jgi:hypothetical protein